MIPARIGSLVYTIEHGYYGILLDYNNRTEKFLVFLGNGLRIELKQDEFVSLPLKYGQSPLAEGVATANFQEVLISRPM